jgi:hypothetical protein
MRLLIAISSCWDFEKNGSNQMLRDTWLPYNFIGLDFKFFFGVGQGAEVSKLGSDSVLLPGVDDGYGDLSKKTQHSLRWAAENDYDFVYRCFPDTYCRPERLANCGFRDFDYYGDFRREHCGPDNYPSGGPGYFLSRKAYGLLLDAPIEGVHKVSTYAEDLWAGQILNRHRDEQLRYFDDPRFVNHGTRAAGPLKSNTLIATHLSCPDRYHPGRMQEKHQQWMDSQ